MQALRTAGAAFTTGDIAIVDGYYNPYDKGGGTYVWDDGSMAAPNDGTVIAPNDSYTPGDGYDGAGRWFLLHNGVVNVRQFGALGDDTGLRIADNPYGRFEDTDKLRQAKLLYPGALGNAFACLTINDTIDWCAIQAALIWCGENGARCEAPEGVFKCSRPVWIGDDTTIVDDEVADKDVRVMGLTFVGQTGNSRQQADGGVANIRLVTDCTNRYVFSQLATEALGHPYKLLIKLNGANAVLTAELDHTATAGGVVSAIGTAIGGTYVVALVDGVDSGVGVLDQTVYFTVRKNADPTPKFLGEILVVDATTGLPVNYAHCFPDCAIVSFRRSAGVNYRLENLTLKGNSDNLDTGRLASFGVLFVTTQFFGHICERIEMAYIDTAVGILKGTGNNGEQSRIDRLHALEVRRMLYTNAPQAFSQEFLGWNGHLQNLLYVDEFEVPHRDLTDLVYAEFDDAGVPGFGANFYNASGTFSDHDHPETDATIVRAKRGTGTVQFVGGRFEHTTRLFNYDAISSQGIENNMDVVFRGVEFTLVGGGDRRLVNGEKFEDVVVSVDTATQYGLFVDTCSFVTYEDSESDVPEFGDLIFESLPIDRLRCAFQNSRFLGVRSLQQKSTRIAFRQCYKNDFIAEGANGSPLRQFTDEAPLPGERTQSLRNAWQDTPWIQTGPRVNVLQNADFRTQAYSANATTVVALNTGASWDVFDVGFGTDPTDLAGFGKWGAFPEANISPSPEAFFISLIGTTGLTNTFSAVDLTDSGVKVLTYQALVKVTGKLTFALVRPDAGGPALTTYDSVEVVGSPDTTLVTLRLQLKAQEATSDLALRIINYEATASSMQVFWQQAWYGRDGDTAYPLASGLANAGFARSPNTAPVQHTYPWAVNALGVRVASRFQLPFLDTSTSGDAKGMGWKSAVSPTDYDLQNGEVYYDEHQAGVLAFAADNWYMLQQPDRILFNPSSPFSWIPGLEKNIVFNTSGNKSFSLSTNTAIVAPGTIVRVFNFTGNNVTWTTGGGGIYTISNNQMSEFVFYNDSGTGKWLITQSKVAATTWP